MAPPPPATSLPTGLLDVAGRVEARVSALLDAEESRWVQLDAELADPIAALRGLVLAGGKRLRPAFVHWGFVAAGGDPDASEPVDAGAAFEVLQGFALIHDDIMDGSAVRRGSEAVHRAFMARHEASAWSGEPRRFGEGAGILVGDLALVYADLLMPLTSDALAALWHELRIELNMGQYLDLVGTATRRVDRASAHRTARYKSGRYTIERPLQVGSHLAGDPELANQLSAFGGPLGEAFQLRDDVLGVFGDPERTGKPVGDDLREGKPTVLLAEAHEHASSHQLDVLSHVGDPDLDQVGIVALQRVLIDTGALDRVEAEIESLRLQAEAALVPLRLAGGAREALVEMARFVVARDG